MFSVLRRAAKCRIFVVVGFLKLCGEKKKSELFSYNCTEALGSADVGAVTP